MCLSPRQTSEGAMVVSLEPPEEEHSGYEHGTLSMPPSIILDNDTFSISDDESMGDFPEFPELDDCTLNAKAEWRNGDTEPQHMLDDL